MFVRAFVCACVCRLKDVESEVTASDLNHRVYRRLFKAGMGRPQIPHLAILLKDLFQLEEVDTVIKPPPAAAAPAPSPPAAAAATAAATAGAAAAPAATTAAAAAAAPAPAPAPPSRINIAKLMRQYTELGVVFQSRKSGYHFSPADTPSADLSEALGVALHPSNILDEDRMYAASYKILPRGGGGNN